MDLPTEQAGQHVSPAAPAAQHDGEEDLHAVLDSWGVPKLSDGTVRGRIAWQGRELKAAREQLAAAEKERDEWKNKLETATWPVAADPYRQVVELKRQVAESRETMLAAQSDTFSARQSMLEAKAARKIKAD
jgi:hypothetical protein